MKPANSGPAKNTPRWKLKAENSRKTAARTGLPQGLRLRKTEPPWLSSLRSLEQHGESGTLTARSKRRLEELRKFKEIYDKRYVQLTSHTMERVQPHDKMTSHWRVGRQDSAHKAAEALADILGLADYGKLSLEERLGKRESNLTSHDLIKRLKRKYPDKSFEELLDMYLTGELVSRKGSAKIK